MAKFELGRVSTMLASPKIKPCEKAIWDDKNEVWHIDIDCVDDILCLIEGHGVIITSALHDSYDWLVYIYDDYYE
jgi:hypothetical protein